jgi:hypothetical protein
LCGIAEEPFWPLREELLRLQHLGALQVADFGGDALDRGGDDRQRGENMAWRSRGITWVETGSGSAPWLLGDMFLDRRIDVGEGADRARNRAGGDFGPRVDQPGAAAVELGIGLASFSPKVTGSAWMPCERPMQTVSLCSKARRLSAASSASISASRMSVARPAAR